MSDGFIRRIPAIGALIGSIIALVALQTGHRGATWAVVLWIVVMAGSMALYLGLRYGRRGSRRPH
jgi:uncharacterized membrane protein